MSVGGSTAARDRLREIDDFLHMNHAAVALERWLTLLTRDAYRPLDIHEFGSVYLSAVEVDLVAALAWLQEGEVDDARRVLAHYASAATLPFVLEAANFWIQQLKEAGVMLPHFEDTSNPKRTPSCSCSSDESSTVEQYTVH